MVMVQFVVDKDGTVSQVNAISGPEELNDEAVRVIRKSGKWTPAIQNGREVRSYKKKAGNSIQADSAIINKGFSLIKDEYLNRLKKNLLNKPDGLLGSDAHFFLDHLSYCSFGVGDPQWKQCSCCVPQAMGIKVHGELNSVPFQVSSVCMKILMITR